MTKATGRASYIGWRRGKFRVEVILDGPPDWPINVVWDAWPIIIDAIDPRQQAEKKEAS